MKVDHFTTGDGCRIAWTSDGSPEAPAVILSTSLGMAMAVWTPQVECLANRFRVIRYDTRGHGRSDAPAGSYGLDRLGSDVLELCDALGLARFAFCGVSLGGMTGQWLGVRAPERLSRLVIANSSPFMGPPSNWDARIRAVQAGGMATVSGAVLERWFTADFRNVNPGCVASVHEMLVATAPGGYAGCCAAIRDMDMRPVLGLIKVRTLIIGGTEDPATPIEHTRALTEGIRDSRCVMLKAAHLSNLEQPEQFNAALLAHLEAMA